MDGLETMIRARGLEKRYGRFQALTDVDLEVRRGEKVVLCGPSGSGKSTLIRCMNGLEAFQGGSLEVCGVVLDGRRRSVDEARRRTGMVFQTFNLFSHLTVLENCMIAPVRVKGLSRDQARVEAMRFLERVHVSEQATKYPAQLSGGQQQRVAIARALAMNPDVMLFDEPTSSLDPEMVGEVLETMAELAEAGMTMLCVTHEMNFARKIADRVIFMDAGRIVETSDPRTFFAQAQTERAREFLSRLMH